MMKKILSLVLAIAVLSVGFTSFVSAATLEDAGDGVYLIDGAVASPASATPVLNITVTQAAAKADISAYCKNAIDANGFNFTTMDVYKVDFALTGLGELVNGYDMSFDPIISGLSQITITLPSTSFAKSSTKAAQIEGGSAGCGTDAGTGDFNVTWTAGDMANPYPVFDTEGTESRYIADGALTLTIVVGLTKGTVLNVSNISTLVNYIDTGAVVTPNTNAALKSAAFPPVDPVEKITTDAEKRAIAKDAAGLLDRSGAEAAIGQNYGITKFTGITLNTATKDYFLCAKDTADVSMDRKAINFAQKGIEGAASFYVIIKSGTHTIADIWIEGQAK